MSIVEPVIREVREDDDFDQIRNLLAEKRKDISFPATATCFFPKKDNRRGYVAEVGLKIIAFIVLDLRGRDGVIEYAMQQSDADTDNLKLLNGMIEKCENVIIERGGKRLSYFAFTEFGQLRNREIYGLERLGFRIVDDYMRVSTHLSMQDWHVSEEIDTENINVETLQIEDVYQILMDDGNAPNAIIFKHQFRMAEPSNVFLTFRNEQQNIKALAYYKVKKVNPSSDILSATALNLHFRPQDSLTKNEKRQFLQGVLLSIKQLDVQKVNSLMSLKNADIFTLMVREGFDEIRSNFFALTKTVGSENETI